MTLSLLDGSYRYGVTQTSATIQLKVSCDTITISCCFEEPLEYLSMLIMKAESAAAPFLRLLQRMLSWRNARDETADCPQDTDRVFYFVAVFNDSCTGLFPKYQLST